MSARFYEKKEKDVVCCRLCPHNCIISPGKYGICRTRCNKDGELDLPFFGRISSQGLDPIEKKPLYHFYPGKAVYSVGFWGCSFKCPFCQNFRISQYTEQSHYIGPDNLVESALAHKSFGIAYTYSEPLIHMEYLLESSEIAHKRGLKNILVSNGYVNPEPANELLELLDAANIDLKAYNPEFYKQEIGGNLEDVKRFISLCAKKIHCEVTTLIIPTKNSTEKEVEEIARFLASVNPEIPLHLSCYFPTYKYTIPPTPPDMVERLALVAGKYLSFVYIGNAGRRHSDTCCPECDNLLVRRIGYTTEIVDLKNGFCGKCGKKIPIKGV